MVTRSTRRRFSLRSAGPSSRPGGKRALQAAAAVAAALAVLLWWLPPDGDGPISGSIRMTTGVPGGVYERYGELLTQRLAQDLPEVETTLLPSQGSVQNIERVAADRADLTIAQADAVAAYLDGHRRGARRLRACARLYDDYIQLVVSRDSPVRSAQDLAGLRVGVGEEGSGVRLIAGRLLAAAGLDPDRDITAVGAGIDRMPGLLTAGELDAFFWSGGLPTTAIQQLAARHPIRLVQLEDLVPALHRQGAASRYYRAAVLPADAYPSAQRGQPVRTVAVANLLVTTERAPAVLIEGITRSVIRGRDRIGHEVHAAQLVDLRTAIYTHPLPLHQGARRYYRSTKS